MLEGHEEKTIMDKKLCAKCLYLSGKYCDYIGIVGHSKGTPPGSACLVFKPRVGPRKKKQRGKVFRVRETDSGAELCTGSANACAMACGISNAFVYQIARGARSSERFVVEIVEG